MKKSYSTEINFLSNKTLNFPKSLLSINLNDEDGWYELVDNSIASYENILVKIYDYIKGEEKYLFLKNANLSLINDSMIIETFSEPIFYEKIKKQKIDKTNMNNFRKLIDYYESKQKIGLDIDEFLEYKKAKDDFYKEKLISVLKLKESE
ncbi:hypothetical protein NPA07_04855 [Mycoplasmopsis caviae]|uniref:Uncharacterized protein n=1 Tax=Mycoplasmopsis caviae TaxID=55603 RepID=A0A3P8KMN8_9BACT|nr:hypothetical protein [Mycoplasmopsis caviae]UUD35105.1 hypothetical protein NPA07_04855 [Mycoplasmopsis caviae]VDR42078.1 Uncharacterised protein [Mycoplasmopsis caviae]